MIKAPWQKQNKSSLKSSKKVLKMYSMDDVSDKILGKVGTTKRDKAEEWYEKELEQELKTREIFGYLIKTARKAEGLTQEELASRLGLKKSAISKLENSHSSTRIETIVNVFESMNLKLYVRLAPDDKKSIKTKSKTIVKSSKSLVSSR